jgi:hypothetical protein
LNDRNETEVEVEEVEEVELREDKTEESMMRILKR